MKFTKWFSGQKILKNLFDFLNLSTKLGIEDRWLDEHTPGVVKGELNEFVIPPASFSGLYADISTGKAYDSLGERILVDDATVVYNANNIYHTTFDGNSYVSTPISSGCKSVPLTDSAINYVWIRHIDAIDDSVFTLHQYTNFKQFYKQDDGYQILVTTSAGVPAATIQSTYTYSLLATVSMPSTSTSYASRSYSQIKEWKSKIVTPLVDLSDKTQSYTLGNTPLFLDDHIKAVGTASLVGPNNPHGTSIYDGGFSDDYRVSLHNKVQHSSGFIKEPALPTPLLTCLAPVTIEGGLTTYADSDALGLMKLAWDSTLGVSPGAISTIYSEYVVVEGLSGNVNGGIIIDKTEIMGTVDPDNASYWRVDFVNSSYPTGYPSGNNYYVYIDKATRKIAIPALAVPAGDLVVCTVSINNNGTAVSIEGITDYRIFGTISNKDIQNNSITTPKILDSNVTTSKIADGSIIPIKITPNISQIILSDDFSTTSVSYVTRTGALVSIITTKASSNIMFSLSSGWTKAGSSIAYIRINLDNSVYRSIGINNLSGSYFSASGTVYFSGLSVGNHTITIECKITSGDNLSNLASSLPEAGWLEMFAMEI